MKQTLTLPPELRHGLSGSPPPARRSEAEHEERRLTPTLTPQAVASGARSRGAALHCIAREQVVSGAAPLSARRALYKPRRLGALCPPKQRWPGWAEFSCTISTSFTNI